MAQAVQVEEGVPLGCNPPKVLLTFRSTGLRSTRNVYQFVLYVKNHFPHGLSKQSIGRGNTETKIHTLVKHVTEFTSASSYKKHLLLYEDKKRHMQKGVGKGLTIIHSWERHSNVHLDKKMFKCPTWGCDKSFKV